MGMKIRGKCEHLDQYLDSVLEYKKAIKLALACKKYYGLSSEQRQFIQYRHSQIINLMKEMEEHGK